MHPYQVELVCLVSYNVLQIAILTSSIIRLVDMQVKISELTFLMVQVLTMALVKKMSC
jgi:hypothetical protein